MKGIDAAIIPVAGLGTRMLPATKEQPKEMLPVPYRDPRHGLVFKPFLQLVFEQLYHAGIRSFVFVVGRGKRSIEDHFTPDWGYTEYLRGKGKHREAMLLAEFYSMLEDSTIAWVNQPHPRGFGDAVLRGAVLVDDKPFIVHAGDITLLGRSRQHTYLQKLVRVFEERRPDALLLLKRVSDPSHYGVALVRETDSPHVYRVVRVVEKPREPISNLAITAVYVFTPVIVDALKEIKPGPRGEVELTDAIQVLIEKGMNVEALESVDEQLVDIGRPEAYISAVKLLAEYS